MGTLHYPLKPLEVSCLLRVGDEVFSLASAPDRHPREMKGRCPVCSEIETAGYHSAHDGRRLLALNVCTSVCKHVKHAHLYPHTHTQPCVICSDPVTCSVEIRLKNIESFCSLAVMIFPSHMRFLTMCRSAPGEDRERPVFGVLSG